MALVDYGSSDESESEALNSENKEEELKENLRKRGLEEVKSNQSAVNKCINGSDIPEAKLFSNLPLPKSNVSFEGDVFKLLNKNKHQPVKILLPSLTELQSGDTDEIKKKKPSTKGSGLFALLPAPKNVNNLVPKSITNKVINANKMKSIPRKKAPITVLNSAVPNTKFEDVEEEDDREESPSSFFFTSSDDNALLASVEIESLNSFEEIKFGSSAVSVQGTTPNIRPANASVCSENEGPSYVENTPHTEIVQNQSIGDGANLDDEAIEKLCGTRARKRKGELSEEVIDINVESMVGDAYMWLSKDLTKEHEHRGFKKAKNLSVVERRKHQITYLASQAKEKEMELRNQWANSRMTRKQTQSKYGF